MRVIVLTDLEGVSGVVVWDQSRNRESHRYQEACRLLMGDIAAAVEGCLEAGATDILVTDGHGGGFNFMPELMHPGARYLTGVARPPMSQRAAVYSGFDAAILLGYHAMQGTPAALLRHTQSSRNGNRYWYGGRECGEIAQSALVLGANGVPVVMVTGDQATAREARAFLGEAVETVTVKEALGEQFGILLAPEAGRKAIRKGARRALERRAGCRPFTMDVPLEGHLRFPDKATADAFEPRQAQRLDDLTFRARFARLFDIYEF